MTAFLTCCALTRPSTSVRKSCGRSDQRMPPRATLPKRISTASRRVELVDVGAARRLHRIDEMAQNAVLVEAFDLLQRGFDRGGDLGLELVAPAGLLVMRVEAAVKQPHQLQGDVGVLHKRGPQIVL